MIDAKLATTPAEEMVDIDADTGEITSKQGTAQGIILRPPRHDTQLLLVLVRDYHSAVAVLGDKQLTEPCRAPNGDLLKSG